MEEGLTGDGESETHGRPIEPDPIPAPKPEDVANSRKSTEPLDLNGSAFLRALHALDPTEGDPEATRPDGQGGESLAETIADGNAVDPTMIEPGISPIPLTATHGTTFDDDGRPRRVLRGRVAPGTVIGCCEILEMIGRGGMGEVYRARQRTMKVDRIVALKLIRANLPIDPESPTALARFHIEMMAAAQLQHDHIVPVYEVGEYHGSPYYTMLLVDGLSLAERLRTEPMSGAVAAVLLEPIARAVALAHSKGIVHRDLKPSNIILNAHGKPYLTDFGLAKTIEHSRTLTKTDAMLGSPPYMSPEQARDSSHVGPASDVYGLGATFYEMLTGRPPFQAAEPIETMRQVIDEEPVPPRQLNSDVPRELETICLKCLEKDPARRFTTADALADELKRFSRGDPILTRPPSPSDQAARWVRRRPGAAGLVAAVVLSLLSVLADQAYHLNRARKELAEAQFRAYCDRLALASEAIDRGLTREAEHRLNECPEPLRGWEWRFLVRLSHRRAMTLNSPPGPIYGLAFQPEGEALAAGGGRGSLGLWAVGRGEKMADLPGVPPESEIRAVVWTRSPDGRERIAAGGDDGRLLVWSRADAAGGWSPPRELGGRDGAIAALAFSPDARRLAAVGDDGGRVWELDHDDEAPAWRLDPDGKTILGVSFGPWNDRLITVGEDQVVRLWSLGASGTTARRDLGNTGEIPLGVAVSHSGRLTAVAGADGRVTIWNTGAPGVVREFSAHFGGVNALAFSPDDLRLATAGADRMVKLWDTESWSTVLARTAHNDQVEALAFHSSGQLLASAAGDGSVVIWDAHPWNEAEAVPPRSLRGHVGPVSALAVRGDGRAIATAGADAVIRIRDPETGRTIDLLHGGVGKINALAYSPDDALLASAWRDGSVRLWRPRPPGENTPRTDVQLLGRHAGRCIALAFSPDGRILATGGADRIIRLWDVAGLSPTIEIPTSDAIYALAFSPDGLRLAVAGAALDHSVAIRAITSDGAPLERRLIGHQNQVNALAFSPDGCSLVSVSHDGTGRIWNLETDVAVVLHGHQSRIWGVAYSRSGRLTATAGGDGTIRIWAQGTGALQATLFGHQHRARAVAFDPQERFLASADDGGDTLVWDASRWRTAP